MKDSPFANRQQQIQPTKVDPNPRVDPSLVKAMENMGAPASNSLVPAQSPLTQKRPKVYPKVSITAESIDAVGVQVSNAILDLNSRVQRKRTLDRFGEAGKSLVKLQMDMNGLKPDADETLSGVRTWFRQKFTNVKAELITKLRNADAQFEVLTKEMRAHVANLAEWERDDEQMYSENYTRFGDLLKEIEKIKFMRLELQQALVAWPDADPDDPEAMLRVQDKMKLQDLLDRASVRTDDLKRQVMMCELGGPEILAMQNASSKIKGKFTSAITDVIPAIRDRLTREIQRLNMQNATGALTAFSQTANDVIKNGAQGAKDAVLNANKVFQAATIETETLTTIQNSVRDMITGIQQITVEGEAKRVADAKQLTDQQHQLLQDLQNKGAV